MIDWYVLLVPLVLVPIALLFVFVGCDLDEKGLAEGRKVILHFEDIPKKTKPLLAITAKFILLEPGAGQPSPSPVSADVTWAGDTIVTGNLPANGAAIFWQQGAVDCSCEVTLGVEGGWPMTLDPTTALDRSDPLIEFKLTYSEWPPPAGEAPPPEYQKGAFLLVPLIP